MKHTAGTSGKFLLRHMLGHRSPSSPRKIAEDLELIALSTPDSNIASPTDSHLEDLVNSALTALPSEVAAFKAGHVGVMNKIVGWVMKESRGRADANAVRKLVRKTVIDSQTDTHA